MKKLFTTLHGSSLYGTKTPTSDRDVKHIVLPNINDLLLGRKITNVSYKTNEKLNTQNTVDDVDEEFIPLQIFAQDFMNGQTYALEIAFAVEGTHAEQHVHHPLFLEFVNELKQKFLTSNIKALVGYVVSQASLYSAKGERLNVSHKFQDILSNFHDEEETLQHLWHYDAKFVDSIRVLLDKYPNHFKLTEYDVGGNNMKPCFTLLNKTLPFTLTVKTALMIVNATINRYGSRVKASSVKNVDWKATMHALRIADEGVSLLETHQLKFPLNPDNVQKLLSIRRGEVLLEDVTSELTAKLDKIQELEMTSSLKPASQQLTVELEEWLVTYLKRFYGL